MIEGTKLHGQLTVEVWGEASVSEKKTPEVGVLTTPTRLAGGEDEKWEIILDLQKQEHSRIVAGPRSFVGTEASVFQYRRKTK